MATHVRASSTSTRKTLIAYNTDFTSYMQTIGIISLKEHIEINKGWLDPTSDEPYYL